MSWTSGKDSAFALHEVRQAGEIEVVGLLTTMTSTFGRVSMHGVREALLDRQMEAARLPCWKVPIPSPCPELLKDLPSDVDPCGENGEFHSFVSEGPMFSKKIEIEVGEVVERDGFVFADVRPAT